MTRSDVLDKAKKCVCGERDLEYGCPENNFEMISRLWNAYTGCEFCAEDVAVMMALMKIARIATGHAKEDSFVDACGYMACAAECSSGNRESRFEHEIAI